MKALNNIIYVAFAGVALASAVQAVNPPPDGGYPGGNTAEGQSALLNLTTGTYNAGIGIFSLLENAAGNLNTGVGAGTLLSNTADENTATGAGALLSNTTGINNTGGGAFALFSNTTGSNNTAVGNLALENSTGNFNTALGANAGTDPGIGSNNVYIGDPGFGGDENVISIGGIAASGTPYELTFIGGIYGSEVNTGTALPVYVDTDGHLGTSLVNASGQKLRIRGPQGAQHQASLNEFQKQQKRIAELEATVARLVATVKDQTAQIEKVSTQLDATKPAPQMVNNP